MHSQKSHTWEEHHKVEASPLYTMSSWLEEMSKTRGEADVPNGEGRGFPGRWKELDCKWFCHNFLVRIYIKST